MCVWVIAVGTRIYMKQFRELWSPRLAPEHYSHSQSTLCLRVCEVRELVILGYVSACCVSVTLVSSLLPSNSAVYCLEYIANCCVYACWNDHLNLGPLTEHCLMHTADETGETVSSNQIALFYMFFFFCESVCMFLISPPGYTCSSHSKVLT